MQCAIHDYQRRRVKQRCGYVTVCLSSETDGDQGRENTIGPSSLLVKLKTKQTCLCNILRELLY